jgi:hypothetical protein
MERVFTRDNRRASVVFCLVGGNDGEDMAQLAGMMSGKMPIILSISQSAPGNNLLMKGIVFIPEQDDHGKADPIDSIM